MGKINGCLKCIFIFFNVLFALFGCLMIFAAVRSTAYSHQMSTVGGMNMGWSWVFAISVLGVSSLGIYAGCSEKPVAIKIFAGFMGVGMIIMLIFGIVAVVSRNKIRDEFQDSPDEVARGIMSGKETRDMLDELQETVQCCGVVRAEDWNNSIPDSCKCSPAHGSCKSKPRGASGPDQIYDKGCIEFIYGSFHLIFNFVMGICFAFAVTAFLGLLVSLLMIHQVKNADMGGAAIAMKGY